MIRATSRKATYRNHELRHGLGSCCSACAQTGGSCAETGPPIGPPFRHTHQTFGSLGDVTCDSSGNCYDSDTGVLIPGPNAAVQQGMSPFASLLMSGPNPTPAQIAAGMPVSSAGGVTQWLTTNATMLTALAAVAGIAALTLGRK